MAIETPFGWGWDRVKLAAASLGSADPDTYWTSGASDRASLEIRRIGLADLRDALARGVEDFGANRTDVIFLCLIYPIAGLLLARFTLGSGLMQLVFPLAAGFALLGPATAVGVMEMSRRREQGRDAAWGSAFGVVQSPSFGAILSLSLALLAIFLVWMGAAQVIYDLTLGPKPPVSAASFGHALFTTGAGWALIAVGIGVGAVFAILVLAISVVAFPLLLDAPVGVEAAVRTSVRAVRANPVAMAAWGLIVTAGLVVGSLPFLLGLVVVLPVLGHATWHLYRRILPSE